MSAQIYYLMHVAGLILLTAATFHACADPRPNRRKSALITNGILSLLVLVGGFGLMARLNYNFTEQLWIVPKIVCWLALSAIAGMAFRRPGLTSVLRLVTSVLVVVAVYLVYFKPAF